MNPMNRPEMTSTTPRIRCEGDDCRKKAVQETEPAAPRLRLCRECLHLFVARLRRLPALHAELEEVLGGRATGEGQERTSGGPVPSGLPFNAAAADVRADITATLSSWSGLVVAERGAPTPQRTVTALAALLVRHAAWLAAHPAVADATREVARLVRAADRVAHSEPPRRVSLGPCVMPGCPGRLVTELRGRDVESGPGIRCDADGAHIWPGRLWTELRRAMRRAGDGPAQERWLTASDVARLWSTPTGTVYRLASEQRWRRRSTAGRTYYAESDVHACFARRRAAGSDAGI